MKYLRQSIIVRLLCAIIALSISTNALASSFFLQCLKNPCDCGCSDIKDKWPSTEKTYRGKTIVPKTTGHTSSCLCPPYNKKDGRRGCLLRRDPPEVFNIGYINICAEESPESNYFNPKIRYRTQACNIACWTLKGDLTGDGECAKVPTSYGIPLVRLCARMSIPADLIHDRSADEGYTPDKHLDFEGHWVDDNPLSHDGYQLDGTPKNTPDPSLQLPKICLYWDPDLGDSVFAASMIIALPYLMPLFIILASAGDEKGDPSKMLETIFNPDLADLNPIKQPEHHTTKLSPFFQVIVDMIEGGISLNKAINNMVIKYPWLGIIIFNLTGGLAPLIALYAKIAEVIAELGLLPVLKFFGTLNRVVVSSYGCVNVPLGPFPPPYCPGLPTNISLPKTQPICATTVLNNGTTMLQHSTTSDPCKLANASCATPIPFGLCMNPSVQGERNNAIHNLIRVGFEDKKPLCVNSNINGGSPTANGKCVNINGTLSASSLYANNNNTGIIKLCSQIPAKAGETPCVESTYLLDQCKATVAARPWHCDNGLRVLYSIGSSQSASTEYYDKGIPDCMGINSYCQATWGVNIGSFADIPVVFPQKNDNITPRWSSQVILPDPHKNKHIFQAAITRTETTIGASAMSPQESDQICVYEKNTDGNYIAIGCNTRAMAPKPKVRDCSVGGLCTSSFLDPQMILKLEVPAGNNGFDFTEGSIGTSGAVNLAGYNYDSYATDKTFVKKPFSGPKAILNGASIFGNYVNDIAPYSVRGDLNPAAVYLDGVEYINDVYQVGAQYLCLTGYKSDDCFSGQTRQNCVLAGLLNTNVISCYVLKGILSKYPSIDVCNPSNTNLTCNYNSPKESYDGKNNNKVKVIPCVSNTSGLTSYCYDYGAQNGPLCAISEGGVGRIVPNTNSDVLLNGVRANIDYYNYTPGVAPASNTATFSNVGANATLVQNVVQKAKEILGGAIAFQYNHDICTPASTPFYTNDMIQACTAARTTAAKITAICTQTKTLVTNKASALYAQLSNVCSTAQTNINSILKDQYNTQLLSQMQSDAGYATTEISNLLAVIKNFSNVPTLVTNIVKAEQEIYNNTDVITYPTPISKINAICAKTQSIISERLMSPIIYDALGAACTTAKTAPSQAKLDTLHKTINGDPLNAAIRGFAQYNIANDGGNTLSANSIVKQTVAGDYIAPDFETMIVRNRTDLENGLCVGVPPPVCPATSDGNATWTAADMGKQSIGKCKVGYAQPDPTKLKANCLLNKNSKTVALDPAVIKNACVVDGITDIKIMSDAAYPFGNISKQNIVPGKPSYIEFHASGMQGKWSRSILTFNITDLKNIDYFNLGSVIWDDYVEITVNGKVVYTNGLIAGEQGRSKTASPNLNLKQHLKNGTNTIGTRLHQVGGGQVYYKFIYNYK